MLSARQAQAGWRRTAFTLPEILIAAALVLLLLFLLLPVLKRNRELAHPSRGGANTVAAVLRRVESAKSLYAADHHLKAGAPVMMSDLVHGGYLKRDPDLPTTHFEVGPVGTPVRYTFTRQGQRHLDGEDHNHAGGEMSRAERPHSSP